MITDKNEAFKHNSCKKIAQLAKVIFQMSSLAKDRQDELQMITIHYESTIAQIVRQHYALAEGISKDLVSFRKTCIDQACQDYGNAYKNIKTNYSNLCRSKLQKLSDIYDELKKMLQFINDTKVKSINDSDHLSKHATRIQNEIANYNRQGKIGVKKKITASIIPINDKITKLQAENDKKFKQMKNEHSQNVKVMKGKINKIYQAEIAQMKPAFLQLRNRLEKLGNDADLLRSQYKDIYKNYSDNYEKSRYQRNLIISSTKNQFKEKSNQINDLLKGEKIKKAERAAEINELQQLLQKAIKAHQNELNDLINQINAQKHLRHQLMSDRAAEMEKMRNSSDNRYQQLIQQCERSIKERNLWLQRTIEMINESNKNMSDLKSKLTNQISSSIEKQKAKQGSFTQRLNEEILKTKAIYDAKLLEFRESAKKRINLAEQTLQKQDEINCELQNINSRDIHNLLIDLKNLQAKINSEMTEKSKKVTTDKENYQSKNRQIEKQKKEELSKTLQQKKSVKEKELKNLNDKFSKDLAAQKAEREKENQTKLAEYINSIQSILKIDNEEKQHQTNLSKIKAKLQVATNNVLKAEDEKEKVLNLLQNKIQNCEKENRQVQRRIEKEVSTINEEYEMKIQVEQVRLNNAIENLSKLYDKDENQRGVELIDMIRKLREMHNRTNDLILRKKKEIEQENEDFLKEKAKINEDIENIKKKKEEEELKVKHQKILIDSKELIQKIESELKEKINQTSESIDKLKNSNYNRVQKVRQEMAKEDADYQLKVAEFQSQKQDINKNTSDNIAQIQAEFDTKIKESKSQHVTAVNRLKQRIESAKSNLESFLAETTKEIKKAQNDDADLIHRKCNEDITSIESVSKSFISKDHRLADNIKELSKNLADLSMKLENPMTMRNSENVHINNQRQKLNYEDSSLQKMFEDLYIKIDKMGKNPRFIISPPDLVNSRSANNLNNDDLSPFPDSSSSSSSAQPPGSAKSLHIKEPSEPFSARQNARRNSKSVRTAPKSARSERGSISLKNMRALREPQVV